MIEGLLGKGWRGDMAIDDIEFRRGKCAEVTSCMHLNISIKINSGRPSASTSRNGINAKSDCGNLFRRYNSGVSLVIIETAKKRFKVVREKRFHFQSCKAFFFFSKIVMRFSPAKS